MILETLKVGSTGRSVRYLQDLINRCGIKCTVDGNFGTGTDANVKALQKKFGLTADGIVGQNTWRAFSNPINMVTKGIAYTSIPAVKQNIIPIDPETRPGTKITPEWFTVHNTANLNSTDEGEASWLTNPTNDRTASWHFAVDDDSVTQAVPDNEKAWHAGDSVGNSTSIGLEVCESGDQVKTYQNAVAFTASYLLKKGWDVDRVTTHQRWSAKVCPRVLLPKWNQFVADVYATLNALKNPIVAPQPQTTGHAIMGTAEVTVEQAEEYLHKINPAAPSYAMIYKIEGETEGVRWDIAFAQSLKETNYFRYGGDVTPDQNNFSGLGTTGGGVKGLYFPTPQIGIRAQIQHLKAYASKEPLKGECVDERFKYVTRGTAPNIEDLGSGKWAADKNNYGGKIWQMVEAMKTIVVKPKPVEEPQPKVEEPKAEPIKVEEPKVEPTPAPLPEVPEVLTPHPHEPEQTTTEEKINVSLLNRLIELAVKFFEKLLGGK